jgi:hypothetical protein
MSAQPNPFIDQFTVKLGRPVHGDLSWNLLDARGIPFLTGNEGPGVERFAVLTEEITSGTYLLLANDNEGAFAPLRLICLSH